MWYDHGLPTDARSIHFQITRQWPCRGQRRRDMSIVYSHGAKRGVVTEAKHGMMFDLYAVLLVFVSFQHFPSQEYALFCFISKDMLINHRGNMRHKRKERWLREMLTKNYSWVIVFCGLVAVFSWERQTTLQRRWWPAPTERTMTRVS